MALCSTSAVTQQKTSLQASHYLGPVHTVRTEKTSFRGKQGEFQKMLLTDTTFDSHGNTTEWISYNEDGRVRQRIGWESQYDAQGRVIERRYLDDQGRLTNTGRYTYPENQHTVILTQINPCGSINHTATRLYDEAGNLVGEALQFPAHASFYQTMIYDKKGNLIERRSYKGNDELTERSTWKYDDCGNELEWILFMPDRPTVQMTKRSLTCDERGNIVHAVNLGRTGSVTNEESLTYVFDDHGNWTRKTTVYSLAGKTLGIEIMDRTITYY